MGYKVWAKKGLAECTILVMLFFMCSHKAASQPTNQPTKIHKYMNMTYSHLNLQSERRCNITSMTHITINNVSTRTWSGSECNKSNHHIRYRLGRLKSSWNREDKEGSWNIVIASSGLVVVVIDGKIIFVELLSLA